MGDAKAIGNAARISNILSGAARTFFTHHLAVIIQLQRDTNHLIPLLMQKRRYRRGIHSAGHGHHHFGVCWCFIDA